MQKPPKVTSEMPSSLFLRQTAMAWGTKRAALPSKASPKTNVTISLIRDRPPRQHALSLMIADERGAMERVGKSAEFAGLAGCKAEETAEESASVAPVGAMMFCSAPLRLRFSYEVGPTWAAPWPKGEHVKYF